jgi:hypothetical protein
VTGDGPRYRRFTRKETLLRPDQLVDLAALARYQIKQRRLRVERITENTLVRIAIDLLLDNQDLLDGSTEAELAESIMRTVAVCTSRPSPTGVAQHDPTSESATVSESRTAEVPNLQPPRDSGRGSSS